MGIGLDCGGFRNAHVQKCGGAHNVLVPSPESIELTIPGMCGKEDPTADRNGTSSNERKHGMAYESWGEKGRYGMFLTTRTMVS